MKVKSLALLAGAGGSLFFAGAADASFTGLSATVTTTANGEVFRIFANFDNTADHMTAVAGTSGAPMIIEAVGGTFYQNVFGSDRAPNPALIAVFPSIVNDTYVTIGTDISTGDQTGLSPGWPSFGASSLTGTNLAYFITPSDAQGDAATGQVLLGQFTIVAGLGPAGGEIGLQFDALLQFEENGTPTQLTASEFFPVPAPGALALLGLAGLVGRPRRRRA